MRVRLVGFVILLLISFSSSMVIADTIDLRDFYADPSVSVDDVDGKFATMSEDPPYITVFLSDDPGMGDPILLPSDPFVLSFSYTFTVAAGNHDSFWVTLFDADADAEIPNVIEKLSIDYNNLDASTDWSVSGTTIWSIVDAPSTSDGFGLEFLLNSYEYEGLDEKEYDQVSGSTVKIRDVEVTLSPAPEPATIFIFGLGLVGLAYAGRKNMFGLN